MVVVRIIIITIIDIVVFYIKNESERLGNTFICFGYYEYNNDDVCLGS